MGGVGDRSVTTRRSSILVLSPILNCPIRKRSTTGSPLAAYLNRSSRWGIEWNRRDETTTPAGPMSDPVFEKRDNHCFISYASEDGALAQRIANWLGEAGLRIWFDQDRLGAGAPVQDELARQVCNSRAFLLVATEK